MLTDFHKDFAKKFKMAESKRNIFRKDIEDFEKRMDFLNFNEYSEFNVCNFSLGGSVMIQRVNGSLAVSRALGDFEYKNVDGKGPTEQLVSPEPEFYMKKR